MATLPTAASFTASTVTEGQFKTALADLLAFLQATIGTDSVGAVGMKNLLINGAFSVNQRAGAGGALAAGVYGFDRWKAGTGGCTISVASGVVTLTGPLVQVLEAPDLAGAQVTVSVEDPSGDLTATVDGVSGTITAGSGRRGVTLTVPGASTGNVTLTLAPTSGSRTFRRVQLERGPAATTFERRLIGIETALCQRYFFSNSTRVVTANGGSGTVYAALSFPVRMRATPTVGAGGGSAWTGVDSVGVDGVLVYATAANAVIGAGTTFSAEL